jgi:hypothetical protein
MAESNSTSKFPAPYVNTISENDSMIIRVDQDKGEIGSRTSGLPKGSITSSQMGIEHVGGKV